MKTHQLVLLFIFIALLLVSACKKHDGNDLVKSEIYTLQLNDITNTDAILRLNCVIGKEKIKSLGFKWKKTSENNFNIETVTVNPGISTFPIKNLVEDAEYLVRAFMVVFSGDTVYGKNDVSFRTHGTMTDIDGNTYFTMRYGEKVWMTNNLRVTRYADGTELESRSEGVGAFTDRQVYFYDSFHRPFIMDPNYGLLYNWAAAVRVDSCNYLVNFDPTTYVQGICPDGWHIPSSDEWSSITSRYRGYEMKTANWTEGTYASNNYSQFSAEPAGYYNCDIGVLETFLTVGDGAYFWTTTARKKTDNTLVFTYRLYSNYPDIHLKPDFKQTGYSVRCVKD